MPKVQHTTLDGQEYPVHECAFEIEREDWNKYRLEDGTQVRVKVQVFKIFRVVDEAGNPQAITAGDDTQPHVIVRHRVEIVASPGADE